jgi:hypothetical protein
MTRPSVMMLLGLSKRIWICWKTMSTLDRRQAFSHNISEVRKNDEQFACIKSQMIGQSIFSHAVSQDPHGPR